MKNINKIMFLFLSLTALVWSCSKDENKVYYEGGTAPVLTASSTEIPLTFETSADEAITFSWVNPNYKFTTGVSSQNVSYVLEIDTTGSNFTNPNKKSIAISQDLSQTLTQSALNDYLLNQLVLKPKVPHNIDVRIKSTLANNSAPLYSNVLKFTVTPFAIPPKVTPPTTGDLWIIGDAVAGGWDNPIKAPYDVAQKFTKKSETLYELTVPFVGGGGYKLIQTNGVWNTQYHALDGSVLSGGDFEMKDAEPKFPGPSAAGTYKVTIDFQRGKYTVVAQ